MGLGFGQRTYRSGAVRERSENRSPTVPDPPLKWLHFLSAKEGECGMPRPPALRAAHEGRAIAVVGDVYRFLATGEDTNGKYALWEALVPPGGGPPPHVHSREEEGFYILEGEITFTIGEKGVVATARMF